MSNFAKREQESIDLQDALLIAGMFFLTTGVAAFSWKVGLIVLGVLFLVLFAVGVVSGWAIAQKGRKQ